MGHYYYYRKYLWSILCHHPLNRLRTLMHLKLGKKTRKKQQKPTKTKPVQNHPKPHHLETHTAFFLPKGKWSLPAIMVVYPTSCKALIKVLVRFGPRQENSKDFLDIPKVELLNDTLSTSETQISLTAK